MREIKIANRSPILARGNFEAHLFKGKDDIKTLREIGRLRCIAFKDYLSSDIIEDLDEYDLEYHHIYLRDLSNNKIVGAYRLGVGSELYGKCGVDGFYLSTLFKLENQDTFIKHSLELGRSFVLPEYQRNYLSLLLLWKAVYKFFNEQEQLHYIIGPVSIPCDFDDESNEMIVDYLCANHKTNCDLIPGFQNYQPKNKWEFNSISDLEEQLKKRGTYYPILLKKYLSMNATVRGFNIDPEFGNSIDVFVCMQKDGIPDSMKKCLTK